MVKINKTIKQKTRVISCILGLSLCVTLCPPAAVTGMCWRISLTAGANGLCTGTGKWLWRENPGLIRSGERKWHILSNIPMRVTGKA